MKNIKYLKSLPQVQTIEFWLEKCVEIPMVSLKQNKNGHLLFWSQYLIQFWYFLMHRMPGICTTSNSFYLCCRSPFHYYHCHFKLCFQLSIIWLTCLHTIYLIWKSLLTHNTDWIREFFITTPIFSYSYLIFFSSITFYQPYVQQYHLLYKFNSAL